MLILKKIILSLLQLVALLLILVFLNSNVLTLHRVDGDYHEPGFKNGNIYIVYKESDYKEGDTVLYSFSENKVPNSEKGVIYNLERFFQILPFIKAPVEYKIGRILTTSGKVISCCDQNSWMQVDAVGVNERMYLPAMYQGNVSIEPVKVPLGSIAITSNNRVSSKDIKIIPKENIYGVVGNRVWPIT